ncbi:MAG: ribonuclease J, partial [Acidobacteria bacterium]|nr:ribonuclease J [Acidobacteriota bacterium]
MNNHKKKLEIIPFGGVGEFGMNMMGFRLGEEMIVLDAGMMFPDESLMGVDVVIPDLSFFEAYATQVKAILITHVHEDHIGSLPFLLKVSPAPVYATRFTLAVAEHKLREHGMLDSVDLHPVEPGDRLSIGPFQVEFIRAAHSTIDCIALAITTPFGTLIHATDFKLDESPIIGDPTDLARLKEIAREGVLALLCDSTNVERKGRTPSERAVIPAFEKIFENSPGRLIFTCFGSSIHRIQIILEMAYEFQCQVALVGQTLVRMVETASREGYLNVPDDLLITPAQVGHTPRKSLVMIA